ncbi:hypothetical protein [Maribellus mangrovi]|uniref:hypothetical protein n=1 Tax=Maribellus mangrovi TaxID=3133146 RepID=UPI0030EDFCDB
MKTLVLLTTMLFLFAVNGYSQKTDVQKMMQNKETRTEIFNAMVNNHQYMSDFMNMAKNNDHAMMMMNNGMMGQQHQMNMNQNQGQMQGNHQMMGNGNTMGGMINNPQQMQKMMENMLSVCDGDSTLRSEMSDIISNHPKMMKMIRNNGMNMHGSNTMNMHQQNK